MIIMFYCGRMYVSLQQDVYFIIVYGLDVLYSSGLIHLMPREDRSTNEYQVIGL